MLGRIKLRADLAPAVAAKTAASGSRGVERKQPRKQAVSGRQEVKPHGQQKTEKTSAPQGTSVNYNFFLPPDLRNRVERWGPEMKACIDGVRAEWMKGVVSGSQGVLTTRDTPVRVGTDCSGAEAPVWALRAMMIPLFHAFSCDWAPHVQKFIKAVCPPQGPIYQDMLKRQESDVPDVDLYVCGFPCTPYSHLRRHRTRLMAEPAAKPFFAVLRLIKAKRPATFVLENVLGLRKVMDRIVADLKRVPGYYVFVFAVDPKEFGEPISRPRIYILGVRQDKAVCQESGRLGEFIASCIQRVSKPVVGDATAIMLPNSHPEVLKVVATNKPNTRAKARAKAVTKEPQWKRKHAAFAAASKVRASGVAMSLPSERSRDAWRLLQARHGGKDLVADVSQSVERAAVRTDGCLPTVTPKGTCCVAKLGRSLTGAEKLLVHGFPLHKMVIPRGVTQTDLGNMGGNTMHLKSVGFVMAVGLGLMASGRQGVASEAKTEVAFIGMADPRPKVKKRPRSLPRRRPARKVAKSVVAKRARGSR